MAITITRDLNVVSVGVPPVIHLSQYDSDFTLVFNLYASTGAFTMPTGTTAEIRGTKRDGNGYDAAASVSGSTVTVTGDEQMTAIAGQNMFEIATYYNNKRLNTINFILDIERASLDADTITSESVLRELDAIIQGAATATQAAEDAEDAADRAEEAADDLSGTVQQVATNTQDIAGLKDDFNDTTFDLTVIESSTVFSNDKTGLLRISLNDIATFVTPETYGAVGDGETDDSEAVQDAVDSDYEYIIFENTYLIKDINITKQKFLFFKEGSAIKLVYYDASKQLFHNAFSTSKKLVIYGLNVTGEYNDTSVTQQNYTEPIILGDACDVFIYNSKFKDLKLKNRGSSPSELSSRRGIVVSVINGGNLEINNCIFENLNNEEWIQCLSSDQVGTVKVLNCQFKGGTGFSRVTVSAKMIVLKNNTFSDAVYNGSLINCFGIDCLLEGNSVKNCSVAHIFDCSETIYSSKKVICRNNTIINKIEETSLGNLVYAQSYVVLIESNYIYGKPICKLDNRALNNGSNIVIIRNNRLEDYYASNSVTSANAGIPINVIGAEGVNLIVSICNNSIGLSETSVNIGQPIAIISPTRVYIKSNELFLGKPTLTTAKYLSAICFMGDLNSATGYICDNLLSVDNNRNMDLSEYTRTYVKYPKDNTYKVKQLNNVFFGHAGTIEDSSNNIVI